MPLASGSLRGKVALITGSSSGIGAGTANYFASLGASLMLTGRNVGKLQEICEQCRGHYSAEPANKDAAVHSLVGDVNDDDFLQNLVKEAVEKFGKMDILVNNAGTSYVSSVSQESCMDSFDEVMRTNLRSVFYLCHLAIPHLIATKGNIVNVSSVLSITPLVHGTTYCMAKAGMDMLTKCLALELASQGVRVNSVNPGGVPTNIRRKENWSKDEYTKMYEASAKTHPLGRTGTVEEVAQAIGQLCSEDSSWMTGTILFIDGGLHVSGIPQPKTTTK